MSFVSLKNFETFIALEKIVREKQLKRMIKHLRIRELPILEAIKGLKRELKLVKEFISLQEVPKDSMEALKAKAPQTSGLASIYMDEWNKISEHKLRYTLSDAFELLPVEIKFLRNIDEETAELADPTDKVVISAVKPEHDILLKHAEKSFSGNLRLLVINKSDIMNNIYDTFQILNKLFNRLVVRKKGTVYSIPDNATYGFVYINKGDNV